MKAPADAFGTDTVSAKETYQSMYEALSGFFPGGEKAVFQSVFVGLGGVLTESDFKGVKPSSRGCRG